MQDILANIQTVLLGIGATLAALAFIALGIKAIFSFKSGNGLREIFQGVGVIIVGVMLIGGGTAFAGALLGIAKSL